MNGPRTRPGGRDWKIRQRETKVPPAATTPPKHRPGFVPISQENGANGIHQLVAIRFPAGVRKGNQKLPNAQIRIHPR